jgi:hypothetical protein
LGTTLGLTLLSLAGWYLVGGSLRREVAKIVPHIRTRQASPPKDDMTWQELQDYLNASGLSVERSAAFGGTIRAGSIVHDNAMWFGPSRFWIREMENEAWWLFREGYFRVTKHTNANDAKKAADRIVDFNQRPAFAWGLFLG